MSDEKPIHEMTYKEVQRECMRMMLDSLINGKLSDGVNAVVNFATYWSREVRSANNSEANLRNALKDMVRYAEKNICTHDSTHRGGVIWTICDDCGAEWADDKGGKPEFKWPKEVEAARKALAEN